MAKLTYFAMASLDGYIEDPDGNFDWGAPDQEVHAQAFTSGLVDDCRQILAPIVVGGGKRALPDHVRLHLELLDECRFSNGMVHLHYRTAGV